METGFVVCVGTLGFFVLLFGFILLMRYLDYRETLKLAEKGLLQPYSRPAAGKARRGGNRTLIWGVIVAAVGLALTIGLYPIGLHGRAAGYPMGFGPWMLGGLVPLFFGLALILIHVLTAGSRKDGGVEVISEEPLPPVEAVMPVEDELPVMPAALEESAAPQAKGKKKA